MRKLFGILCVSILTYQLNATNLKIEKVVTHKVGDVFTFFNKLNYTQESWKQGDKSVPRIQVSHIPKSWAKSSQTISVNAKKKIFFRLLAPMVLKSNELILQERKKLIKFSKSRNFSTNKSLIALAKKYRILKKEQTTLSKKDIDELLARVDKIPLSLALAQGASESGWGTSRFALLGNSLFGQWDFSGNGIKPKQQRKELGNYGLAKFNSPQDSVNSYIRNLNTHRSYKPMRDMRAKNRDISGYKLTEGLIYYSERREEYIKDLKSIITFNKLDKVDDAYLSGDVEYHITPFGK